MTEHEESDRVAVVRRLIEDGIDDLDQGVVEETTAATIEVFGEETTIPRERLIGETEALHRAMPDLHHHIDATWEADGTVIVHYTNHGTFEQPLELDGSDEEMVVEAEPTGEEIFYSGVALARVEHGRVVAWANYPERLRALRQMGVLLG